MSVTEYELNKLCLSKNSVGNAFCLSENSVGNALTFLIFICVDPLAKIMQKHS